MLASLTKNQRTMIFVLVLINFLNYLERNVIFPLFHPIQLEFGLTDFQLGLLGTVFLLVHSIGSVPLGILADKYSRKLIIAGGVLFWSLATFASGLAQSFRQLLGIRSLVGLGESSYAPAAANMIADNFPEDKRGQAQGLFSVGLFLGGTLGAIIGGLIAYYFSSWRLAFFIVALPGIVLSFSILKVKDKVVRYRTKVKFGVLFKSPAYWWMLISGTLISFAAGGLIAWGVEFVRRYKGYNLRDASIILGISLMVAGVLGVLIGSWLADRFQKRLRYGRALLISLSFIIGAPFMLLGIYTDNGGLLFLVYFFLAIFLTSFYHGPAVVVLHDIVPHNLRGTAYGIYLLIIHLLGDTLAPAVVGRISDMVNLQLGMGIAALCILIGGFTFLPICYLLNRRRASSSGHGDVLVS